MAKLGQALVFLVGVWVVSQAFVAVPVTAQLSATFYDKTCKDVSNIVKNVVAGAIKSEPRMAASLLRVHFHDCFVKGCDASILLDGPNTEKTTAPNLNSVRGYEVIDGIKAAVEKACPNVVSCADIVTMASFHSVGLSGGPSWPLLLGRRDALVTDLSVIGNLPGPFLTVAELKAKFAIQNLDTTDLVALSGGHTIGIVRCAVISNRLYSFGSTGQPDPTLNRTLLGALQKRCPRGGNGNVTNALDQLSENQFDNLYFRDLFTNSGLLTTDQELFADSSTKSLVQTYANNQAQFFKDFGNSMVKMGNLSPLTGSNGQIRKNCRVPNTGKTSSILQAGGELASELKGLVDQMRGDALDFFTQAVKKVVADLIREEEETGDDTLIRSVIGSKRPLK